MRLRPSQGRQSCAGPSQHTELDPEPRLQLQPEPPAVLHSASRATRMGALLTLGSSSFCCPVPLPGGPRLQLWQKTYIHETIQKIGDIVRQEPSECTLLTQGTWSHSGVANSITLLMTVMFCKTTDHRQWRTRPLLSGPPGHIDRCLVLHLC